MGDVDVRLGRDLARDDDEPGRDQGFAGDAPVDVVPQDGVEHRVRHLVGDLVGMPLGDGLRREQELAGRHARGGYLIVKKPEMVVRSPSCFEYSTVECSGAVFARTSGPIEPDAAAPRRSNTYGMPDLRFK